MSVTLSAVDSLDSVLRAARADGRAALVGYLPAGFPSAEGAVAAARAMVEGGVDVIELGLPYSDPVMDGPVIQRAAAAALAGGATTETLFDSVAAVAETGVPVLCMTYWNPVERYGVRRFAERLAAAGGHGLVTPDLIPEEAAGAGWTEAATEHGLARVHLVAPSSSDSRVALTAAASSGFVYAASMMGVTGTGQAAGGAAADLVARVRATRDIPVCVGIGVSTRDQAAAIGRHADGVIVGAAFVRRLLEAETEAAGVDAVREFAADLAAGLRSSG
ncbi:tryptophan synthase subunit alpha [Actinokineospora sp. NBRC 105648]|uniref:tryptophan synthase subunit alpha n=1 Tax=Actinokineospora sp. NBRC 105648 TaxID=3032206 RepID=UPI0024A400BA|nr:tryptophan synthase subunit alpha [Actinokineospora sp. NBRC 105648]GLZ42524.1 tryptophan synthase alpha chain [Actinokineospora sp. NBRC 105648]